MGVSSLVIGLTVVAFGTSAPEIGVATVGAVTGSTDAGLGNIIGSNIFNLLLVVGLVSLLSPLAVQRHSYTWRGCQTMRMAVRRGKKMTRKRIRCFVASSK